MSNKWSPLHSHMGYLIAATYSSLPSCTDIKNKEGDSTNTRAQFNGAFAKSVQHNAFYKLPKAISKPTFIQKKKTRNGKTKFFLFSGRRAAGRRHPHVSVWANKCQVLRKTK